MTFFANHRFSAVAFMLITSWFISSAAVSQQTPAVVVKGVVQDAVRHEALAYVTVTVLDRKTKQPIRSMLSKEDGTFEVKVPKGQGLVLAWAFVGYEEQKKDVEAVEPVTDLGVITLKAVSGQLKEVAVTASRPILKQEADRISFDVQADPENKVNTVLDMLRKVPLVSVDGSDNIKLKGNTNFKILLNGKPSSLLARNPSDVFRSMPASNIIRIEVITTPPAKYDAEGLAGIINIITKRNIDEGYNGSVNARYNSVFGPGINLNGTVKKGKIGLNGYIGYNRQNKQRTEFGFSNAILKPVQSNVLQNGQRMNQAGNGYGNAELSYEIDTLNLLTGSIEFYQGKFTRNSDQLSRSLSEDAVLLQQYRLFNQGESSFGGTDLSLNYERGFAKRKGQLLTTSYKYGLNNNLQNTDVTLSDRFNYKLPDYLQYNKSGTKEHTVQLDYVHPVKAVNIEAGAKAILRNNFSHFTADNFNEATQQYVNDPLQTNDFRYLQDVYSVYNSYQLKLKKSVLKAGLRLEHTTVDADFTSTASKLRQEYNNLVPSLSMQQNLTKTSSFTFGYSQRIQRPGIWQLNPFIDRSNPKWLSSGNPNLRPVVNRNFEIGYSNFAKGSVNLGLSYSFANNTVENVTSVGADTVTLSTYQNVGSNKRLGLSFNTNYPFTARFNLNVNSQLLYVWLKGTYNNQFYSNTGFQGYMFINGSYKFNKGWRAGFNAGVDSRYVLLQGRDNYWANASVSGSKVFMKEKATLSFSLNNPWSKFIRLDYYTASQDFSQRNYNYQYYRTVNVTFNYKFGKLNSSIKKNQRNIRNDDVNGSSR